MFIDLVLCHASIILWRLCCGEGKKQIKTIAAEIEVLAEEIASRLDECNTRTGQIGFKHFRDVIVVVWRGMRMDPDAQMKRLEALRNEIQSELLVSLTKKLDWVGIQSTKGFQKLDDGFKALIGDTMKVLENSEDSAQQRHGQIMEQFQNLNLAAMQPAKGGDSDAVKQGMIEDLKERLWYSSMKHRHHAIRVAHRKTFEWIFTGQRKTAESNTTFMEWISAGNGLFWVSGRAGTGKSSLMRFLEDDPRTLPVFQTWAGERPLVLATFYFWNSEAAGLIIDGLDEFEATSSEQMRIAEILCQASRSPDLKIVVSSRPENAFETAFRNSTKLRLRQLTQADRRLYVFDKLSAVPRLQTIATDEEQQFLFDLVVERSEGIFLWVHLAVETLIQEIAVSMGISKLENVIKGIPSGRKELAQVFDHMLRNRIPAENRRLGHCLIETMRYCSTLPDKIIPMHERTSIGKMTSLAVSFFEDDVSSAIQMPVKPLLKTEAKSRIELSVNLMRRYCGGLLEARPLTTARTATKTSTKTMTTKTTTKRRRKATVKDLEVRFLHKDVLIFLNQPETQQFLQNSLGRIETTFLHSNFLKCIFMMMKVFNPGPWLVTPDLFDTSNLSAYGHAEDDDPRNVEVLLDGIDQLMCRHLEDPKIGATMSMAGHLHLVQYNTRGGAYWTGHFAIRYETSNGTKGDLFRGRTPDFLSFVIQQGLFRYVESKLGSRKAGREDLLGERAPCRPSVREQTAARVPGAGRGLAIAARSGRRPVRYVRQEGAAS
ncbi:small s protein [Podospora appendiculata]|uniref:Small s protein n=1 Tax=Podospora appendiculata TaxID=314037 RepID=A0AAE0XAW3_9PEZI|nr:small s protein [Podospora appendiculata]